ncbi:MAG TPA: response regulator [Steroidobacteraceae bacterium]|jgi:FixJ family two-component response regulator
MRQLAGTLFIVDDEAEMRRSLTRLLRSAGYTTRAYATATDFLSAHDPAAPGCLILDLALPGMNGLELQQTLTSTGCRRPIIFLSGRSDIPKSVRAMKSGAVNFLTKPVEMHDLIAAVDEALTIDEAERVASSERHGVTERLATLTPRERQVLGHVVSGRINKQIAADLGTAEKTIKVHRSRVMRKMHAGSLVELVKLASLVGIQPAANSHEVGQRH